MNELIFPTKFVADVGTLQLYSPDTLDAQLTVDGVTVLHEKYSPANGSITVRGLRQVLEAAIYGELQTGTQTNARADVALTVGNNTFHRTLYASRLRNPADPQGQKTLMAAGDLVAVACAGAFPTPVLYTEISNDAVVTRQLSYTAAMTAAYVPLADGLCLWIDRTECLERCVCVRFLNRYDVPQTMMTTQPLEVKPGFQDQTALYLGRRVRYSVEQQDEYTLRSGQIHRREEYRSWADLITSRKTEVLMDGQWLPVIVKKSNFQMVQRSMGLNPVEITFQMADPKQGL